MAGKKTSGLNATHVYDQSFASWSLDHQRIRDFIRNSRTFVANREDLQELARRAAIAVGVELEFILVVLKLEIGYPEDYSTYRSTMRGGANNAYIGVTQMYNDFWTDVRDHYRFSSELPVDKESTTLEMQLVAPFLYVERYKSGLMRQQYPLSPAVVYAAHQRGGPTVGLSSFGNQVITDKQSAPSLRVIRAVQKFNRDRQPMQPVYL